MREDKLRTLARRRRRTATLWRTASSWSRRRTRELGEMVPWLDRHGHGHGNLPLPRRAENGPLTATRSGAAPGVEPDIVLAETGFSSARAVPSSGEPQPGPRAAADGCCPACAHGAAGQGTLVRRDECLPDKVSSTSRARCWTRAIVNFVARKSTRVPPKMHFKSTRSRCWGSHLCCSVMRLPPRAVIEARGEGVASATRLQESRRGLWRCTSGAGGEFAKALPATIRRRHHAPMLRRGVRLVREIGEPVVFGDKHLWAGGGEHSKGEYHERRKQSRRRYFATSAIHLLTYGQRGQE